MTNVMKFKMCILGESDKISEIRSRAKLLFKSNVQVMKIPVSENGEYPESHWLCELDVTEAGYKRVLSFKKDTIMEISNKYEFLKKYNLKIIKTENI